MYIFVRFCAFELFILSEYASDVTASWLQY